jgi:hypothetical protein
MCSCALKARLAKHGQLTVPFAGTYRHYPCIHRMMSSISTRVGDSAILLMLILEKTKQSMKDDCDFAFAFSLCLGYRVDGKVTWLLYDLIYLLLRDVHTLNTKCVVSVPSQRRILPILLPSRKIEIIQRLCHWMVKITLYAHTHI